VLEEIVANLTHRPINILGKNSGADETEGWMGHRGGVGGVGVMENRKIPCPRRYSKSGSSSLWPSLYTD